MAKEDNAEAKQLLKAMTEAMRTLNYQGTVVYLRDNKVDTLKVFHALRDGVEQERVVALNTPLREIIRNADIVTCYFPGSKTVVKRRSSRRSFLVNLPDDIDRFTQFYRFAIGPREYVVQRETQVVSIEPKDDYRYGRVIWIDRETRLPLKFELLDENREPLEQMIFTSFSLEEVIPAKQFSAGGGDQRFSHQGESLGETVSEPRGWRLSVLPGGYEQVFHTRRKLRNKDHSVEHILVSDGFASVSVYIEKLDQKGFHPYKRSIGGVHSSSRKINDYQVTVMGEVPPKTVERIIQGISFVNPEQ